MVIRKPTEPEKRVRRTSASKRSLWDEIAELGRTLPNDVIERMPRDGAKNSDHYLHGSPKQA